MADPGNRNSQLVHAYKALRKALLLVPPIMIEMPDTFGNIEPVDVEKSAKLARKVLEDMPGDEFMNSLLISLVLDWLDMLYLVRMWRLTDEPIHGEIADQAFTRFRAGLEMLDRDDLE